MLIGYVCLISRRARSLAKKHYFFARLASSPSPSRLDGDEDPAPGMTSSPLSREAAADMAEHEKSGSTEATRRPNSITSSNGSPSGSPDISHLAPPPPPGARILDRRRQQEGGASSWSDADASSALGRYPPPSASAGGSSGMLATALSPPPAAVSRSLWSQPGGWPLSDAPGERQGPRGSRMESVPDSDGSGEGGQGGQETVYGDYLLPEIPLGGSTLFLSGLSMHPVHLSES